MAAGLAASGGNPISGAVAAAALAATEYTKDSLANEFKGLYWDYAFQKDEDGKQECTKEMLDVLVPALCKTKECSGLLTDSNRKDDNGDGAWHPFYIRPNPDGKKIVDQDWNFNDENQAVFNVINDNAKIAATFPFTGGSEGKAQRASIRCKEVLPDGSKLCPNNPASRVYDPAEWQGWYRRQHLDHILPEILRQGRHPKLGQPH